MAKQTPQDQSKKPEAAFAEWLEARHEWIVRGDADTDAATPKTKSATQIPKDYENADRTLRALAHLRTLRSSNKWRPDALSASRANTELLVPNANGVSQLGRFILRDEVGRGGFGLVYRAFDPELKREVALKIPRPEALFTEDRQRRFEDEAEATARLRHSNICRVHEVGQEGAIRFLVCEFCDGPDLAQWLCGRTEHVPLRFAAKLFVALASGVAHAHSRGVLHRDLKPSNILLEPNSPNLDDRDAIPFTPRIVDFGLAKLMEGSSDVTKTGDRLGTVDYMAPEQAEGRVRDIGVATDVFALGVMLYEVLTAKPPFAGASQGESLKNLLTSDPPRPRKLRSEIPEDLEAICLKCLEKDETKRYGSADDLANDLRRWLDGEPTSARPLSRFQRLDKWTRRRPALAALCGVSLLAIVVLAAVGWSYNRRLASLFANEKSLRKQADESRDALAEQMRSNLERVYAIDMRSALEAMHSGHISAVRERMARYTPGPDQIDMRTTVWRMLSRFCDNTNEVLYRHHGPARHIAGPANGEWFATGGADGMIYIWDEHARSRRAIPESAAAHNGAINDLKVSHEGSRLISCGEDGGVKIWRMPEGLLERVIPMEPNQSRERRSIAISRDGELLAIGGDRGVTLWATGEFNEVGELPHPNGVGAISISPDGMLLATACDDSRVRVWNVSDLGLLHTLTQHYTKGTGVSDVAFAHNSRLLATSGFGDGAVHWFDALSGEPLGGFHYGDGAIHAIAFTPDDRRIVLCNAAGGVNLFDFTDASARQAFTKDAVEILDVRLLPNSSSLIAVCGDGSVRRIAMSRLQLTEHTSPALPDVLDVRLTTRPSRLLTHVSNSIVTLRDLRDGTPFFNISATSADEILERLSISDRSGRFAFVLSLGRVDVRSLDNQTIFQTRDIPQELLSTAISTDGQMVASGGRNGELTLWEINSRDPRIAVQTDQGALSLIRFSNDDRRLVVVGLNDVTLRRAANLEVLKRFKGVTNEIYTAVFLPDDETVATNDGKQIVLWNSATGAVHRLQGHADTVVCLDISPDGSTLASGGRDGKLMLWDVRTTERIGPLLDDAKVINSIDFSPDGKMLAAGVVTVKHRRDRPHFKLWAWGDRNVNDYAPYHSLLRMRAAWPPAGGMRRARPSGSSVEVYANDFDGNEKALDGVIAEWSGGAVVDCEGFAGALEGLDSEPRNERLSANEYE